MEKHLVYFVRMSSSLVAQLVVNFSRKTFLGVFFHFFSNDCMVNLGGDGTTRTVASTQFEAHGASMTFPCFDEPNFKVPIFISYEFLWDGYYMLMVHAQCLPPLAH